MIWTQRRLRSAAANAVADFAADVAPWALFDAEIRQVTVEDGVTALPESSFANCTGLTRVTLGSGIEKWTPTGLPIART